MRRAAILLVLAASISLAPSASHADQVNPSRLEVGETDPGVFSVLFTLPVLQGRKLRAEPVFPPGCTENGEREERWSAGSWEASWTLHCDPPSLAGEAIRVEGLLGTPIDVLLEIKTLDGRFYRETLKPSRAAYVVPLPPRVAELGSSAARAGARRGLGRIELWLLLGTAALAFPGWRPQLVGIAVFALAHAAGQGAAGAGWMTISPLLATSWIALIAAIMALGLLDEASPDRSPAWGIVLVSGALLGAAQPETVASLGLSEGEQRLAFLAFAGGLAVSLLLIAGIVAQVRELLMAWRGEQRGHRGLTWFAGILTVGIVIYYGIPTLSGVLRPEEIGLLLCSILLGIVAGPWRRTWGVLVWPGLAVVLMALGTLPGIARLSVPLGATIPAAGILFLGVVLVRGDRLSTPAAIATTVVVAPMAAFFVARSLAEEVSRAPAHIAGIVLLAVGALLLSGRSERRAVPGTRALGALALIAVFLYRWSEYRAWLETTVATEAALGQLRIPLLSLVLLLLALGLWPRRRKALRALGVEAPRRVGHLVALAAAFLLVPHGSLAVAHPFYEPHAPAANEARLVLTRVLSNSYHAFNLKDEDALYDQLSESVSGELVADLYLDSRRRLTAGTREGSQVTVQDVSVLEVGEASDGPRGFTYPCKWVVTARVQHLLHVHHRQNIYEGSLTIRIEDHRWKIAGVELTSEDRVVVSWKKS